MSTAAMIAWLGKASAAIYLATDGPVADDISPKLREAATLLASQASALASAEQRIAVLEGATSWRPIGTAPTDSEDAEFLGLWIDIDGVSNIVIIHYSPSNVRATGHGFIGRHGTIYGAGGITHWLPLPAMPARAALAETGEV